MRAIAEKLDSKLRQWRQETAQAVEKLVTEMIESADGAYLDLGRSRAAEQAVLSSFDEPQAG